MQHVSLSFCSAHDQYHIQVGWWGGVGDGHLDQGFHDRQTAINHQRFFLYLLTGKTDTTGQDQTRKEQSQTRSC